VPQTGAINQLKKSDAGFSFHSVSERKVLAPKLNNAKRDFGDEYV